MAKLNFDVYAFEALSWAPSHSDAAADALAIAAKYIREEKPLPMGLKEWIADAFEIASLKSKRYRAKALTDELFLTNKNRRPAASWSACAFEIDGLISETVSVTKAIGQVADKYGIDPRTARRYWKIYLAAKE